ncbi:MAG: uroporphyrinogen-III C-methyltransferase [Alphaproteobacteria bacterium]|nr:MAG: uroporphyrinogen-III C-methyltransferase [Alphaproteobacteria bacterium]
MQHFPIYLDLSGARVVICGATEAGLAKLRLLLRTSARIEVWGADPGAEFVTLAAQGRITLVPRLPEAADLAGARLIYLATGDAAQDRALAGLGRAAGALVNIVDVMDGSDFITPAIVDRDPVTVAIGTEGTAPVLARQIKARVEAMLPTGLGTLARLAGAFRAAAEALPAGRVRRRFWARVFGAEGDAALRAGGAEGARAALDRLLAEAEADAPPPGRVAIVGAGPGDPELLTLRARRLLHDADVVIHDRLVPGAVLELARREARIIEVGKTPGGPSWPQEAINALMVAEARQGALVVRLKSGDPGLFGRLEEEIAALDAAGIGFEIVPGLTAASAAAAAMKASLTRRGRNSELRLLTGHDINGFAEQDWRALARPGTVAAIYMGLGAARFLQGRLMMHGADPATPVTVAFNVARPDQRLIATRLDMLAADLATAQAGGTAVILFGLAPHRTAATRAPAPAAAPAIAEAGR